MADPTFDAGVFFIDFDDAVLSSDTKAVADSYTENATLTVVGNVLLDRKCTGRAEIEEQYKSCFDQWSYLEIERPHGGQFTASQDGLKAEWTGPVLYKVLNNGGGHEFAVWTTSTAHYVYTDGVWKIDSDHSVVDQMIQRPNAVSARITKYEDVFMLFDSSKPFQTDVIDDTDAALTKILGRLPASITAKIGALDPTAEFTIKTLKELLPHSRWVSAGW